MAVMTRLPKIQALGLIDRGDDVPACAAAADMVERREHPGHMIGLLIACRSRRNEADPTGVCGHRRQEGQRFQIGDELREARDIVGLAFPDTQRDREENEIRPEEHTSELQSLMRNSYAVLGLK